MYVYYMHMSPIECTPAFSEYPLNDGRSDGVYFKFKDGKKHWVYAVGVDQGVDVVGYPEKGGLVKGVYREPGWWGVFSGIWFHST